jgi:cytochrome P450
MDGEQYKKHHKVISVFFHNNKSQSYIPSIIKIWDDYLNQNMFMEEVLIRMKHMAINFYFQIFLGKEHTISQTVLDELHRCLFDHEFNDLLFNYKLNIQKFSFNKNIIKQIRIALEKCKTNIGTESMMYKMLDSNISFEEVCNEFLHMYHASRMTFIIFNYVLFHLGKNPEYVKQIQDDPLFLQQFIKEILRMYPIYSKIEKVLEHDMIYNNVKYTKGSEVWILSLLMSYDEDKWINPHIFSPQRWKNISFTPVSNFSEGKRNCVGKYLAEITLQYLTLHIVNNYNFSIDTNLDSLGFGSSSGLSSVHNYSCLFTKK